MCVCAILTLYERCNVVGLSSQEFEQGSDTVANTRKAEANVLDCQFKLDAFCFLFIG